MIEGVLENYELPWEERLGTGMRQTKGNTTELITFSHKRRGNILVTTLLKDDKPISIDTYVADSEGRLLRLMYQEPGERPHWTYEYDVIENTAHITRTDGEGDVLNYRISVLEFDRGKIMRAQMGGDEPMSTITVRRFYDGFRYIIEDVADDAYATIFFDKDGRYLKREHVYSDETALVQEYLR
jgi:hypothetical protein